MFENIIIPVIAVSGLGLLFGLGLSFASKFFYVEVDERIKKVREALPGTNCGACGYSGCDGLAEAIVDGKAQINACPVGGEETAKKLAQIMGVKDCNTKELIARVLCNGSKNNCEHKQDYFGIGSCKAAMMQYGGTSKCNYGCIGLGDCQRACPFDAIIVEDGLARIIEEKCTGCSTCVAECPKGIIEMVPKKSKVTITCSSNDKPKQSMQTCKVSCIGCGKCAKVCPVNAITIKNTLAKIDYNKCINCKKCIDVCPKGTINEYLVKIYDSH